MKIKGWFDLKCHGKVMRIYYAYGDTARPDNIQLFTKLTNIPTLAAIKDVWEGIQCVKRFMKPRQKKPPRLKYHYKNVPNTIREKESYRWLEKKGTSQDEPVKENDHCCDAERYCIYTRERGRVRLIKNDPFKKH